MQSSFEMVGAANNRMDFNCFHQWVDMMFGDFTDPEFEANPAPEHPSL